MTKSTEQFQEKEETRKEETKKKAPEVVKTMLNLLEELNFKLDANSKILDFGCGEGWYVFELRKLNFQTFGIDINNSYLEAQKKLVELDKIEGKDEIFKMISLDNYRLPFDSNTLDLVYSHHVFEHVKNWNEALTEIYRVLRPNGISIHVFPSKYRLLEAHNKIPFGGAIKSEKYMRLCKNLGFGFQDKDLFDIHLEYVLNQTKYLEKKEIEEEVSKIFDNYKFIESWYLQSRYREKKYIYNLSKVIPFLSQLISTFHVRVLLLKKASLNVTS